MKKLLLVMAILSIMLCACKDKTVVDDVTNNTQDTETTSVKNVEYNTPDFTDKSDFKINTSSDADGISFERIVWQDESNAQLDLELSGGKMASLKVTMQEVVIDEEEVSTFSVGGQEVTRYKAIDGLSHYIWSKDNFYFELTSSEDIKDDDLEKIVKGYSAQVGANN